MLHKKIGCSMIVFCLFAAAGCATPIKEEAQWLVWSSKGQSIPFQLILPQRSGVREKSPVLVAFHGRNAGTEEAVKDWRPFADQYGYLVLIPLWEKADTGKSGSFDMFYEWIEAVGRRHPVDTRARYLAGASAGGFIVTKLMERRPEYWAGAAVLAHEPKPLMMEKIDESWPPVLFLMGKQDTQNDWNRLDQAVRQLQLRGRQVELFSDDWAGHEHAPEWNKKIADWFMSRSRREPG